MNIAILYINILQLTDKRRRNNSLSGSCHYSQIYKPDFDIRPRFVVPTTRTNVWRGGGLVQK